MSKISDFENHPFDNEASGINDIRLKAKKFESEFKKRAEPADLDRYQRARSTMKEFYIDDIKNGDVTICKCSGFKNIQKFKQQNLILQINIT